MFTNQLDQPIVEDTFDKYNVDAFSDTELRMGLADLLTHLNLKLVRTNATYHGDVEVELRELT